MYAEDLVQTPAGSMVACESCFIDSVDGVPPGVLDLSDSYNPSSPPSAEFPELHLILAAGVCIWFFLPSSAMLLEPSVWELFSKYGCFFKGKFLEAELLDHKYSVIVN